MRAAWVSVCAKPPVRAAWHGRQCVQDPQCEQALVCKGRLRGPQDQSAGKHSGLHESRRHTAHGVAMDQCYELVTHTARPSYFGAMAGKKLSASRACRAAPAAACSWLP
eukprot:scaffold75797_cov20-Tisochrysis_lutea.AAC.3